MSDFVLKVALGECESSFSLENAVCNHGFFMMSPNNWIPSTKTFQRPLRLFDSTTSVMVSISHPPNHSFISVQVHDLDTLSLLDQESISKQVCRMLRISEKVEKDVREFQTLHVEAKDKGFGRIFRSPSLFEDAVKSILLCNCTWKRSLEMAKALCELQQKVIDLKPIGKRTRYMRNQAENVSGKKVKGRVTGNCPSAKELSSLDEDFLKQHCKVGYRSKRIIQLAKEYKKGTSMLNEVEEMFELLCDYEDEVGKLSALPHYSYHSVSGSSFTQEP
ncbi:hypothetical protein HS088_TW16G00955 [Tripterygium wilfordii]|uniref:Uncharacterized protein n=1 Tax=Tripterygium wilfordii TaxID=458696 RepID=A0A7J7CKJ8_TRIWF|nr:hypothetical protein HS088_TW16G00955 [Tripterygium wilfordii]